MEEPEEIVRMEGSEEAARMEEPGETVRDIIVETARRGTVRTEDRGETARDITVRIAAQMEDREEIVRVMAGITMVRIVQTITVEIARRGTARMEGREETARAAMVTAGAETVRSREDVRTAVVGRAEGIRLAVR